MRVILHTNGKSAFGALVKRMNAARRTIELNVFIWRDDATGRKMTEAVLAAADRGVRVTIRKDVVAWVFERAEENKRSLLHRGVPRLWLAAKLVELRYGPRGKSCASFNASLRSKLLSHPNVSYNEGLRYDHAKYVIIDDEAFFVGGMNFEDRFVTMDAFGSAWQDYLIELHDKEVVSLVRKRLRGAPFLASRSLDVILNDARGVPHRRFELKKEILKLLNAATTSVTIAMAYIGDKEMTAALASLARKGVPARLLIPARANVQHDMNFRVARELRAAGVKVFLCKKMLHAKIVLVDGTVLLGSANLNKQAMTRVGELDIYATDRRVVGLVKKELARQFAAARPATAQELSYHRFSAWLEQWVAQ